MPRTPKIEELLNAHLIDDSNSWQANGRGAGHDFPSWRTRADYGHDAEATLPSMSTDPRWPLLQEARQLITDRLASHGVRKVEYVAALPTDEVWV